MSKKNIKINNVDEFYNLLKKQGFFDNEGKHLNETEARKLAEKTYNRIMNGYYDNGIPNKRKLNWQYWIIIIAFLYFLIRTLVG